MQAPIRLLEDSEDGQHRILDDYQNAAGLKKKIIQVAGVLRTGKIFLSSFKSKEEHLFNVYDQEGVRNHQASKTEADNYYYYKGAVLAIEFLWFLYFLGFGIGAFATVIAEVDMGSGWLISWTYMLVVISIFAGLGALFLVLYIYFCVCFMKHGDEQLDELLANTMAIATMYFTALGLLIKYFLFNDLDNDGDDLNYRRLLYTTITGYGVFGMVIIIRAISRHMTIAKEVMIGYQTWRYSGYNAPQESKSDRDTKYDHVYTAKPHKRVFGFMITMWLTTAVTLAFTIWLFIISIGSDKVPDFQPIYLSTVITLGTMYILLTITWIAWGFMSQHYKTCFTSNFDVFYGTHALYIAAIVFMLIGYRYVYWSVPDTFFETPGVTVPALKLAYFNKLSILQLILLPLLSMGIAKGACLMVQEYPVDLKKYMEETRRQHEKRKR